MLTLLNILKIAERVFLVTVFFLMIAMFMMDIVVRALFPQYSNYFFWVQEAVRILNLFLVFCALGLALERKRHVGVTVFRDRLSPGGRRVVFALIDCAGLVFSGYMIRLGVKMVAFVFASGQRSPTLNIPMGVIYLAPTIGFALLGLRYGLSLFTAINRLSPDDQGDEAESEAGGGGC